MDIFEFSRQKSTLESKSTILMIFGAKIQIFQKLTIELKKCHFWRENSNETILMIFIHCVFRIFAILGAKIEILNIQP